MRQRAWIQREVDGPLRDGLSGQLNVSPLLAGLLISRGISDPAVARRFLNPSLEDLIDPFSLIDMSRAVNRIIEALNHKERILIWGDEDCDGVAATAVMLDTLSDLGSAVSSYIPSRVEEGIGLNSQGLEKAKADGVTLLITVDCGMSDHSEVEYSRELGIDVVITDHHELPRSLPEAVAVVNPKRANDRSGELAGVGVAFKVAQGVSVRRLEISPIQYLSAKMDLIPFVLFGTLADKVPLSDENRVFAKFGLEEFLRSQRVGLNALREVLGLRSEDNPTVARISRPLVSLLSSGKPEDGRSPSLDLLLSKDYSEARRVASSLLEASQIWQERAREAYSRVLRKVTSSPEGVLVVVDLNLSPSFLGYCSARLKERFGRPAIIIGSRGTAAVGEGRAPKGFDLVKAFRDCEDLLLDYGGHKPAAGFSLEFSKVREFVERMKGREGRWEDASPLLIDGELSVSELTPQLFEELNLLAPFGESNPPPLFLAKRLRMEKVSGGYKVPGLQTFLKSSSFETEWTDLSGGPIELDVVCELHPRGEITIKDARPSEFNQ